MKKLSRHTVQTSFRVRRKTLIVDLGGCRSVLSSAPRAGGITRARYILNHQVPDRPIGNADGGLGVNARCPDPARTLRKLAIGLGIREKFVGLMTAVSLRELVTVREADENIWVEGFVTVGTSNAVRAGESVAPKQRAGSGAHPGTINLILVTNARLPASAMVGVVQVATEAKTAVLLHGKVKSWTGRPGATGTGTDAVVVVSGNGPPLRYSGTHTVLGELVGRAVGKAVREGLARYVQHVHRTRRSRVMNP